MLLTTPRITDDHRFSLAAALFRDFSKRRPVVILDRAAQRVDHELLRHRVGELIALRARSTLRTPDGPSSFVPSSSADGRVDGVAALVPPLGADPVEVSRARSPSGSMRAWQFAQTGFARCFSSASRTGYRRARLVLRLEAVRHVRRRRRHRRAQDVVENELAAQHRRRAVRLRRHEQDAALAEQAHPVGRHRHATEAVADDVRNQVVPGQPLVDERVVRGQRARESADRRAACCR